MRELGQRALGFRGPPPRRGPAPSGTLTFGRATQRREHGELSPCCAPGSAPSDPEDSPGASPPRQALTWASRAGRDAGSGSRRGRRRAPCPHGLAPGPPGRRARPRCPALGAQRAGALSPPGRRGCSRAAGWRGRTPGSAGCGTRRGSAAPASGPRLWVAPWDAETPCCAAGRAGPGLGSGVPGGREGAGPGGTRAPGRRWPSGGEGQGAGEGVVPGRGPIPGPRREAPARAQSGAARLMEGERGGERSRTSDRHRQTRN